MADIEKKRKGGTEYAKEKLAKAEQQLAQAEKQIKSLTVERDNYKKLAHDLDGKNAEQFEKGSKTAGERYQHLVDEKQATIEKQTTRISQLQADLHNAECDARENKKLLEEAVEFMGGLRRWFWNRKH